MSYECQECPNTSKDTIIHITEWDTLVCADCREEWDHAEPKEANPILQNYGTLLHIDRVLEVRYSN